MNDGPYLVALDGFGCNLSDVGGKAAGLDRLAFHGFPIPESYCVTMTAYRRFVEVGQLAAWLEELGAAPPPEAQDLAVASAEVEGRFAEIPMPPDVAEPISKAVERLLRHGRVAVRSSASAEDLGVASFAGQYRSFVGLETAAEVLAAVRACWASLWLPAVRAYRSHNRISSDGLAMGVVVQAMVEADWSGVGFTIDPERRGEGMRIEVVPGLGEGLVSGYLTPDDFLVDRSTLEIMPTAGGQAPEFLEDLARMLLQVEVCFDAPQDVEWSFVDGRIVLLQARPITVAGPTTIDDDGFDGPHGTHDTFTPRGVVEMLPDVVPPLLWTMNAPMIEHAFHEVISSLGTVEESDPRRFVGRFRGRAALNLSALRDVTASLPGGSAVEVERQFLGRPVSETSESSRNGGAWRKVVGALRTRRAQRRLRDEVDLAVAAVSGIVALDVDLSALPAQRLIAYRSSVRDLAWRLTAAEVAASSAAAAAYRALEMLLAQWLGEDDAASWAQRLTAGSLAHVAVGLAASRRLTAAYARAARRHPGLRLAVAARPVERASERLRQLGAPGRAFLAEVNWIVRSQGSRAIYGGQTWAEDATWAWEQLAVTAGLEHASLTSRAASPPAFDELAAVLAHGRRWKVWRVLTGQLVDVRLRWLRRQTAEASRFLAMRERAKGALLMLGGEERRIIVEGAHRLAASRQIARIDDVELLADGEFSAMLLGSPPPSDAELYRRRTVLERCRAADRLPETFDGEPHVEQQIVAPVGAPLRGWAASPGIVEGRVKVLTELADGAKLERGDVLVAKSTDPSWTPLLLVAAGLLLEEGGPLSHGAIVAREFGLPAVLNVPGATQLLHDGERVQVDGFAGIAQRLDVEEAA